METYLNLTNPIVAVTHPNPYLYYADLVQHRPFYYDQTLEAWVASSATLVKAVLTHPLARVRPSTEPVPQSLLGSSLAEIFSRFIRMNDGVFHHKFRPMIVKTLAKLSPTQISQLADKYSQVLLRELKVGVETGELTKFAYQLPIYVVGSLLGIPEHQLFEVSNWLKDFVQCLTKLANLPDQLEAGKAAAAHLLEIFCTLLKTEHTETGNDLLVYLVQEASSAESVDQAVIVANAIGFLFQTYEATAGLIGNILVALASYPEIQAQLIANFNLIRPIVQEVLRYDPPIQNTRRFLIADTNLAGHQLRQGEMILVLLAAANRDPLANPEPNRFDISRPQRQSFSFGSGVHSCPGYSIANLIAQAAIEGLYKVGFVSQELTSPVSYSPSVNARIPIL